VPRRVALAAVTVLVALVAILLLSVTASIYDPSPVRPSTPHIGIAYGNTLIGMDDDQLDDALDDAVHVGATTVRSDLDWNDVQPESAGDFTWDGVDRVVAAARSRGLSLVLVLAYTPAWARPAGCNSAMCAPDDPADFAAFAGAAAHRYSSRDVLAWEIWNEPNTPGFWAPAVDPAAYARLLVASSQAVRTADRDATILLGGLASVDGSAGTVPATDFLDQVAGLGGLAPVDGVAFHPYTFPYLASESRTGSGPWSQIDNSPDSLRAVLARHGAAAMPIWLTEYGAPTDGPGASSDASADVPPDTTHVTEAQQARIAGDAVLTVAADAGLAAMIWYSDRDLSPDKSTNLNFYGLRRADGSAKPALDALRAAVQRLTGQ
jgi:hypothetical protein